MYNILYPYVNVCVQFNHVLYTYIVFNVCNIIFSILYCIIYIYSAVQSRTSVIYQTGDGIRNK